MSNIPKAFIDYVVDCYKGYVERESIKSISDELADIFFERLSEREIKILEMRFKQSMTYSDIARMENLPPSRVKQIIDGLKHDFFYVLKYSAYTGSPTNLSYLYFKGEIDTTLSNTLLRARYEDLSEIEPAKIMLLRNVGKKSIEELEKLCMKYKLPNYEQFVKFRKANAPINASIIKNELLSIGVSEKRAIIIANDLFRCGVFCLEDITEECLDFYKNPGISKAAIEVLFNKKNGKDISIDNVLIRQKYLPELKKIEKRIQKKEKDIQYFKELIIENENELRELKEIEKNLKKGLIKKYGDKKECVEPV